MVEAARQKRREAIIVGLEARAPKCFLCKWILEDIRKNGTFTGYPLDYVNQPVFPRDGKLKHIMLEGFVIT